ncbi:pre-mRNA cleavage complex 2 protein Pcf11 isoform X1 [Pungitius pungitius]|uniref:pre-mRNA cleavage complex 2 protein Pcf11 isoform X1 n=1 Tax=Pungitius pungitius TaxID=134920 RepID=UPI002E0D9D7F
MDCLPINGYGIDRAAVGFPGSKMADTAAREDACREYQSSLEDLTFNSKPHINMLTILAEENLNFAKDIVAIIEAQISKAPSAEKLPVLYLVDSIVKNVGGEYLAVFAKNLITSFICVFEKVDESTRKSLFKLRSTWEDVFPLKKLYALDVRVNSVDPAWPIKPLPPTVNASIHVNPKFLKQADEAPSAQPADSAPPTPPVAPPPQPVPVAAATGGQSSLTQEQLIRQQLLAKQKQLLELQQKKIELELEQTKAQLAGGFVVPPTSALKASGPAGPAVRPWIPPPPTQEAKLPTRDPRLNRTGPPAPSQPKEQHAGKKEGLEATGSPAATPEKSARPDKARTPRKEAPEEKKSKSPSPMARTLQSKNKMEAEIHKSADATKKDPRLKKRPQDKSIEELKEKKRCLDKKEREEAPRGLDPPRGSKGKLANGSAEKPEFKAGGNARTHARKRSRSRSPSATSPKRKERRSPKRGGSSSPSHKPGKPRRVGPDHGKPSRGDRPPPKKNQLEGRRSKRPAEERHSESRDSPRSHEGGGKEAKEAPHRWRSGWEETKHPKLLDESHVKPQRHKPYGTPTRPAPPRTPKHRLSVDANLQIPEVLNSASKKDLLRRASKRLESGEISQEDFLNMAHQIKHFFQYQEEKQRSDSWDDDLAPPGKLPLLSSPPLAPTPRPPRDGMDAAELSYYEHKSKLRKTQVAHRAAGEEWEGEESPEEGEEAGKTGRSAAHPKYGRAPRDRQGERRSKEHDEPRLIEEYNHGKEFPPLKSLPGLRFRRRADPREPSEREWNSPLTERPRFDEREEQKSGYDAPRGYGPPADPRRPEGAPPSAVAHRSCPSPVGPEAAPRFERERLSPLPPKDPAEMSPVARFESPNSEHSDDGPLTLDIPPPPPKSILKGPVRVGPLAPARQNVDSPAHTPPQDGGHRYNGPGHMGPARPPPPGWNERPGHYDDSARFEGPHHPGPGRFDGGGPPLHNMPHMSHSVGRFDGAPHPQGPGRFNASIGHQPPMRFEGGGHFEGPMQHFDSPRCFDNMAPGSGPMGFQQQRLMRFESPAQPGPRFDLPNAPPLYECPPGQQNPLRFGPQHGLQPSMRPMAPPIYDPIAPQQNFNMNPHRFPEPMNPQFPFNMQQAPPFSQSGPAPFYNPATPALGMQPVNVLGNLNQNFLPQNPVPFGQQSQAPENHFGQVDVNDLLTKLISNGIIKPSQPDAAPPPAEPTSTAPLAPPMVEEEEEEAEEADDDDIPDLTSFTVDLMKHRLESVVTKLYSGNQCCLCSMRFTTAQTDLYADHLDWHFRQNHAGKVAGKKITHRRWYYGLRDWVEFEEIADLEERAKSHFFEKENEEEVQKSQAAAKEKEFMSVKATKDQVGELCEICQEPFETYWVEEEEDWFLKDAIRVDDKNFHPACFEDYKNTSSYVDVSPSPSKLLADHPLSAFIKTEEEEGGGEGTSCAVTTSPASSLKQEVECEASAPPKVKQEEVLTEACDQNNA